MNYSSRTPPPVPWQAVVDCLKGLRGYARLYSGERQVDEILLALQPFWSARAPFLLELQHKFYDNLYETLWSLRRLSSRQTEAGAIERMQAFSVIVSSAFAKISSDRMKLIFLRCS